MARWVKIIYKPANHILAEGPLGWGITQFEGNFYIRKKYLLTDALKINFLPGICAYKFLYVWLNLVIDQKLVARNFAWLYWLPNPLIPFIWFRVAIPGGEPDIDYQFYEQN